MARTYSLNDLGVTADDLILLDASGYSFDETDNISEEKRDEILSRLYDLKHKDRENAQKETSSAERKTPEIPAATDEQLKDMNYRLKHGEHLSAQEVASAVARGGIVSKNMRAEIKNAIVNFTNADNVSEEEAGAVSYLLDELDGKHIEKHKNGHSVEEYKKQFADSPEILEAAGKKLEDVNNAPAAVVMYDKEDIDALLRQGEIYLRKPEEVDNHDILEQANPNYRETHQELFAEHIEQVSSLIKDYAEGRANIYPEALESMEKLVEAYGREYARGTASSDKFKNGVSYDITQDAANAHQRLAAERVAWKELDKEVEPTKKFIREYPDMVENLVKDIAYAGNDADREKAVAEFNKKMSQAMEEAGVTSDAHKERVRSFLEDQLKDDQNLFGYLGNEYNDAAKYLLDENGKLKDGVAVYTAPEQEASVEEEVAKVENKEDAQTSPEDDIAKMRENNRYIRSNVPGKKRTAEQWKVLYDYIDHNPALKTDKDREKARKKLDEDFERTANKKARDDFAAMRKKEQAEDIQQVVEQPVEQKTEQEPEERKDDDKGRGGVAPVVIPGRHITNDKGVTEWEEHKPAQEIKQEKDKKKKKGLFGWLKNAGSKTLEWCKRNGKKILIGGTLLAATVFGSIRSCNGNETGSDDKVPDKDKHEQVVTPTPQQKEQQLPELVITGEQKFDLDMAHQYCKRMGYQTGVSENDAIAKYILDRMTYATVKEKVAGHLGIDSLNIDQQMAILATVRGNTPKNADVINGILNGKGPGEGYNVATLAKLRKETEKFTVRAEDGTIQYRNPEEFTKQTGTQSIEVSKEKITQKAATLNWTPESHTR